MKMVLSKLMSAFFSSGVFVNETSTSFQAFVRTIPMRRHNISTKTASLMQLNVSGKKRKLAEWKRQQYLYNHL